MPAQQPGDTPIEARAKELAMQLEQPYDEAYGPGGTHEMEQRYCAAYLRGCAELEAMGARPEVAADLLLHYMEELAPPVDQPTYLTPSQLAGGRCAESV